MFSVSVYEALWRKVAFGKSDSPARIYFIDGTNMLIERNWKGNLKSRWEISIIPCEVPYLKEMCQGGSVVGISKGIIRNGRVIVTSGPLKGRESLIRKIDRHKRTAKIEIPFTDGQKQVTVGLEIYGKEI